MTANCQLAAATLALCCLATGSTRAQERAEAVRAAGPQAWADTAAKMALAEAAGYDIRLGAADGPRLKLSEQPVLKWSNTDDATIHGSVLLWMHAGRPEAVASIFKFFTVRDEFSVELHSLAEAPLVAAKGSQIVWQPTEAGVSFAPLPKAAAPARSAAVRLAQMRAIARDFAGTMTTFEKTTHPLRLLTQPLVRYAGDKLEPVDGALFAFARSTDPDVLLLLEARSTANEPAGENPQWHYALARMHCGSLSMSYEGREVWSVEQMTHPFVRPKGVYTLFQGLPEPETPNSERH